ncbi:MAG: (2Fe-2S)-binding protein [Desulfarculaceae bacterium]|nr:(2Fe-2S)-binding protein [Desulfarculaceae bacterium]MCF8074431.1 (2Fe-2S)-binding protein [Desulfarculaceae bacterium]MCF8102729.1 (2Fe-2S)-binding protein [Desulfarculaceae bacterium]MCF8116416.1 (2Fe-2S)-binding protein [Desulfarculaceae bacterium]
MSTVELSFKLNGREVSLSVAPDTLLVDLLREGLGLTGTKAGCREGECGACTVLLDGTPMNSCLLPAVKAQGREVTTIEGLEKTDGSLEPLQEAFMGEGAAQCGFCTPAMILTATALLKNNPDPDEGEIRHALSGVICRCTGYRKIVQAVQTAAKARS